MFGDPSPPAFARVPWSASQPDHVASIEHAADGVVDRSSDAAAIGSPGAAECSTKSVSDAYAGRASSLVPRATARSMVFGDERQ